jgi:hypothetical protein
MKRALLAMAITICPAAVAAQDPPAQPAGASDTAAVSASNDAAASQYGAGRRRAAKRGSMTGYIEDATVGSGFSIRFDSGWDMSSPDRAEFFYAKCGCFRDFAGLPSYDPNAPGPGPGAVASLDVNQLDMRTERQIGRHASFFFELPFRWIKPVDFVPQVPGSGSFGNQSGLADISLGTKVALSASTGHDISMMIRGSIPTGDSTKGLGTDHGSIEPALLVRQGLGGRAQIEGELGYWHPTGTSKGPLAGNGDFAGDILYYGIGPSFDLVHNRKVQFAPVVELVGWHVLSGFETSTFVTGGSGDASGLNIVNLKAGARVAGSGGSSFYVGYGWTLSDNAWFDHVLRIEYRKKI